MKIQRYTTLALLALSSLMAQAQRITFETQDYLRVGVYDGWTESPFRKRLLHGNAQVVDNHLTAPDPALGTAPNSSAKILGVQRSRFGSNTFGVRIDLLRPMALSPVPKYVHVLIHRPSESRVLLMGLGKRRERGGQSRETEQFWEVSTNRITSGEWCDAVFEIKGVEGVDIYSLVVVPDLASPHEMTQDFAAYIDDIVINDDLTPRIVRGDYLPHFSQEQKYVRSDRRFNAVSLSAGSESPQTAKAGGDGTVYTKAKKMFRAKAGERVRFSYDYTGNWMHGYAYLDRGNDGKFDVSLSPDGRPAAGSDLLSFSSYDEKDSDGNASNGPTALVPPAVTLPSDLLLGTYRLRFKVDWNSVDAGGNMASDNGILRNGGGMIDAFLRIYQETVSVSDHQLNGHVVAADGSYLNHYPASFGKPFTIRMKPADGFGHAGACIRHGYRLSGDSVVHGNPQWSETFVPATAFRGDEFTIPAEMMDGDVQIEGLFTEIKRGKASR